MPGRYKPYPEYKDSGVAWFDAIPSHWTVTPLKWQIDRNDGGVWGNDPNGIDDTIVLRSTEQTVDGKWKLDDPAPRKLSTSEKAFALLKSGDLLVTKSSGSSLHIGKTTLVSVEIENMDCCYSNFMQRLRTKPSLVPKLAWYVMNNELARNQFDFLSNTTTGLANLNGTMMGEVLLAAPRLEEQCMIVAFLDHETAKIDTLIEKQQQLIKLLKEKRQAVISHAVTKGLNPNAKMRDSGVEWLGQVPETWDVVPLKHLVSAPIIDGPHISPVRQEDGIPFISAEAISTGFVNFEKKWGYISKKDHELYSKRYTPKKGDILMVKLGATTGTVAMVETDAMFNIWVPLAAIRIHAGTPSKFIFYLLQSSSVRDAVQLSWTFGTQQTLGLGTISNLSIPLPSREECEEVIKLIERKIPIFDRLVNKSEHSLFLLKERRTALISAAVTGKIDVRDWIEPQARQTNKEVAA